MSEKFSFAAEDTHRNIAHPPQQVDGNGNVPLHDARSAQDPCVRLGALRRVMETLGSVAFLDGQPSRENLSQRAYNYISSRLTGGAMRPGEKLILRPLAARLGLSPTPVREALLRLVSEQALVLDERGSAIVPVMTPEQFREMWDMRSDLEARAAERAVAAATSADLVDLQQICDATVRLWNEGSHQEMLEANARFHRQVCIAGRSPLIQRILEGLWIRLGPPYGLAFDRPVAPFDRGQHPHEILLAAVRTRNVEAARQAARQDVHASERLINLVLEKFQPD